MTTTLIIPGLQSSGPDHWQTWLEEQIPASVRVVQRDWSRPDLPEWSRQVRRALTTNPGRHIIVAHSFGVLAGILAASDMPDRIAGALLVAPADPERFKASSLLPQKPLPFPTVLVASSNDPWMSLVVAAHWADTWESDLVNLGDAGHINPQSGFGPWPEGLAILERLRKTAKRNVLPIERTDLLAGAAAYRVSQPFNGVRARAGDRSTIRRRLAAPGVG